MRKNNVARYDEALFSLMPPHVSSHPSLKSSYELPTLGTYLPALVMRELCDATLHIYRHGGQ